MPPTRTAPATRKRSAGGFLFGLFTGVVIGLAVSLGDRLLPQSHAGAVHHRQAQAGEKPARRRPSPACRRPPPRPPMRRRSRSSTSTRSCPAPRSRSPSASCASACAPASAGQQDVSKDVYFIQAGSFQNPADADNQKARLAILGFESSVEPANLPDKGTWYRVRMGPYQKLDEINRIRQSLAQNGIEASLVKIKEPQ